MTFLALISAGLVYLAIKGEKMHEISTQIDIEAPPSLVWTYLKDINKWHEWSPVINKSSGELSLGSTLDITMIGKEEGKDGPQYNPKIIEIEENKFFRWRAHMLASFIFTNDKIIELKETSSGTTVFHKELFKGMLAPLCTTPMEKGVPPILNKMNQALKELVEKNATTKAQ